MDVRKGVGCGQGSLFLTRPTLMTDTAKAADLQGNAAELFAVAVAQTYPLKDTAQAHRDLEGRKTNGSTVLLP